MCGHDDHVWTAAQRVDVNTKSKFVWKPNATDLRHHESINHASWHPGEPNSYRHRDGRKEACMALRFLAKDAPCSSSLWNDERCAMKYCFICELNV